MTVKGAIRPAVINKLWDRDPPYSGPSLEGEVGLCLEGNKNEREIFSPTSQNELEGAFQLSLVPSPGLARWHITTF